MKESASDPSLSRGFSKTEDIRITVSSNRLRRIERSIASLEESAISSPELEAAISILERALDRRAKRVEQHLEKYDASKLSREEAMEMFQLKKSSALVLNRIYEMATNQVRTVIAGEAKQIIEGCWSDERKRREALQEKHKNKEEHDQNKSVMGESESDVELSDDLPVALMLNNAISETSEKIVDATEKNISSHDLLLEAINKCFTRMEKTSNESRFLLDLKEIMLHLAGQVSKLETQNNCSDDASKQDLPPAASMSELAKVRDELEELRRTVLSLQANQSSGKAQINEISEGLQNLQNETEQVYKNLQFDLESLTKKTEDVQDSLESYQNAEAERNECFKTEREKLLDQYKFQLKELNEICGAVRAKAEEVRKTGLRMEAKVDQVVRDAAAELESKSRSEVEKRLGTLEQQLTSKLDIVKKSAQTELRSKVNGLREQMRLDSITIRDVGNSLGGVARLEATVKNLEEITKAASAKLNVFGSRLIKQEQFSQDVVEPELEAGKAQHKIHNNRLISLERWRLDANAELERIGASAKEISQKVKSSYAEAKSLQSDLTKENELSEKKLHAVEMALESLKRSVKKDMDGVSSNVKQVMRIKMGNAITKLRKKKKKKTTTMMMKESNHSAPAKPEAKIVAFLQKSTSSAPDLSQSNTQQEESTTESKNGDNVVINEAIEEYSKAKQALQDAAVLAAPPPPRDVDSKQSSEDNLIRPWYSTDDSKPSTAADHIDESSKMPIWKSESEPLSFCMEEARQKRLKSARESATHEVEVQDSLSITPHEKITKDRTGLGANRNIIEVPSSISKDELHELSTLRHRVNTATEDRMVQLKSDLMSHFDLLSARLGSHLEKQLSFTLSQIMEQRMSQTRRSVLQECMASLETLQKQWSESMTAIVRDASFENNTLHRELSRRVIQSRSRKTRALHGEYRNLPRHFDKTKSTSKGWGGELGLKGVGLDKDLAHATRLSMKIELSEQHASDSKEGKSESNDQALGVNQWPDSLPGSRAKTPLI